MTDQNQPQQQPQVVYVQAPAQHDRPVRHGLHLFLSIVTLGAWLPVWLIVAIARR